MASSSSAYLVKVSSFSLSICFFRATISFLSCSYFSLCSSLYSLAFLTFVSSSTTSIDFAASSCLKTLRGLCSISCLYAQNLASAWSSFFFRSSIYTCYLFFSCSSWVFSSLNRFLTLSTSSSLEANDLLTSVILCLSSSSSWMILSSLLQRSRALCLNFVSKFSMFLKDSLNVDSRSVSFIFQLKVISSIFSISLCLR